MPSFLYLLIVLISIYYLQAWSGKPAFNSIFPILLYKFMRLQLYNEMVNDYFNEYIFRIDQILLYVSLVNVLQDYALFWLHCLSHSVGKITVFSINIDVAFDLTSPVSQGSLCYNIVFVGGMEKHRPYLVGKK